MSYTVALGVKINTSLIRLYFFYVFILFIYLFFLRDREGQRASRGAGEEAERQRVTQSVKRAPGSELSAQSLTWA